ncbi:MAG TPA: cob(I)yrinic acid a,c-diamide adenosyltransferase [Longimicrobiales bacterium]|nr:cob(I)yrinic acid a,c-diamide adenosyltransferase [Longimicrobiales bacterium]
MARIYTRTGDAGETGLFGGGRVPKSAPRVRAYGEVDELNAVLGWVLVRVADSGITGRLRLVQEDLFALGAHLATPPDARSRAHLPPLPEGRPGEMEAWIDACAAELEPLRSFILPGGGEGGAALHLARTVCRRAERAVVGLAAEEPVDPSILAYLNRLSDLLFELARLVNHREGRDETPWRPRT